MIISSWHYTQDVVPIELRDDGPIGRRNRVRSMWRHAIWQVGAAIRVKKSQVNGPRSIGNERCDKIILIGYVGHAVQAVGSICWERAPQIF